MVSPIYCKRLGRGSRGLRSLFSGLVVGLCVWFLLCLGCGPQPTREVVVYTALDREYSEPLLEEYQLQNATQVLANTTSNRPKP